MRNTSIAAPLVLSIFFSMVLLLTDAELWTVAPSHAYALAGFMAADVAVIVLAMVGFPPIPAIGTVYGVGKFVVFLGDILTAPEFGLTYAEFAAYLFSLWGYNGLLASQLLVAAGSYLAWRRQATTRS
ncbi:hypothetical protein CSUB_C0829 [Candidatus Caldarchaeum subterraneum]|uniref:Integral membrane protein n=1 Tax=Caldiarchaeum subterraneum TaxID=311458 RepID=E6N693_CALS0|nr:hypothetical protein HGMM_F52H05C21 [Candidatus Caldarchaeum subterraneum]BAJ47886.1 hypothetical protein HGMM_F35E02C49 [Candidatus Caldarchaeum subterraneum]BAJ49468.1 hypothetical protein HGMM_F15C04C17 [Candidatus Caldarchaeum subterraneum]BAJ50686.1 hypothetical protein CSUB_C0829 [Candidatus Caldarchaeum subterraneum]